MAQTVVEKKGYADLLNPIIFNVPNLYPYADIMGKVNVAGSNFRYDGQRTIIVTDVVSGKDVPANLQTYNANATQQWHNTEKPLTIRYERQYRDIIDKIYEVTGKPLNTAVNVLAAYEKTERPTTITSQYSENLYEIASDNSTIVEGKVETAAAAIALFNKMNEMRMENTTGRAIFYCTATVKALLKNYIATARRWSNDGKISFDVDVIDDVEIKVVPKNLFKNKYTKTSGYTPASDAIQLNAAMVCVDAMISPFILDDIYIDEPSALSDGKSFILSKFAFDLFVHPKAADYGVIVSVDAIPEV